MFLAIAEQIHQREPVVSSQKVEAVLSSGGSVTVDVRAPLNAALKGLRLVGHSAQDAPHLVAIAVVPLQPIGMKGIVPQLIASGSIPRLCDPFRRSEGRIFAQLPQQGRKISDLSRLWVTVQNRGEIKSETIYAQLVMPVAQALDHPLSREGMTAAQSVSAAGVVAEMAIWRVQIGLVRGERLEVIDGAGVVEFGGVVVDDV